MTTMTRYRDDLPCPVAFGEREVHDTMAEVLAAHGARQLHVAETEKYAHVTYFFNGGREQEWEGETRVLVPSPRDVATYDQKPEMSAAGRRRARSARRSATATASASSTSRTRTWSATPASSPPSCGPSRPPTAASATSSTRSPRAGGVCLITADHGNAETMLEADGVSPHTAHTTNPVPLVLTAPTLALADGGELSDLAPTASICSESSSLRR